MRAVYTARMDGVIMGGFFGLEEPSAGKPQPLPFAESACCAWVSSGRAALECLLRGFPAPLRRVHVPRFTCDTVLEPLQRMGLGICRYACTEQLNALLPPAFETGDAILLTNYFGLTGESVRATAARLHERGIPVLVDATTALFAEPLPGVPSFYSPRKFVGVADGGIACAPYPIPLPQEEDDSDARSRVLWARQEQGALAALPLSEAAENDLHAAPRRMAPLTRRLLARIDFRHVAAQRLRNYRQLHKALAPLNHLHLPDAPPSAPFCYPFVSAIPRLRDELIDAGIALPLFWPEVLEAGPPESAEHRLARRLLPLPLDQRYGEEDMARLLRLILG